MLPRQPLSIRLPEQLRPVRMDWLRAAAHLPGKTLHVAVVLWWDVSIQRSATVRFSRHTLEQFGVSRDAAYDALKQLLQAGLIRRQTVRGQTPHITLLDRAGQPIRVLPDPA